MNRLRQVGEAAAFVGSVGMVAARMAVTETSQALGSALRKQAAVSDDPITAMIATIDAELRHQTLWHDHLDAELALCQSGVASAQRAEHRDTKLKSRLAKLPERVHSGYTDKLGQTPLTDREITRVQAHPTALLRHAADLLTRGLRPDATTHFRTTQDNLTSFMSLAMTAAPEATLADLKLDPQRTALLDKAIWTHYEVATAQTV